METDQRSPSTVGRRRVLFGLGALVLAAGSARAVDAFSRVGRASAQESTAGAATNTQLTPTPRQTEGPYFRAGSPEMASLTSQTGQGTLTLTGQVLTTDGQPVAGAMLDFWQADAQGQYDNGGYNFRGHQYADGNGRFSLHTVMPGLYPGRTRHIHVKVQAPGAQVVTSQLYLPDDPRNARDGLYNPALEMSVQQNGDGTVAASYTFVV